MPLYKRALYFDKNITSTEISDEKMKALNQTGRIRYEKQGKTI